MTITAINPASGEIISTYPEATADDVTQGIENCHRAFLEWKKTAFSERVLVLKQAAHILTERRDEYSRLMALEMGKPIRSGRAEIEKCAWACEYFADQAETMLMPEIIETDAGRSFVSFQPLGVILAIMPWNYPFWQIFRLAAPALMAGNGIVLKHASNVPGCTLAIGDIFTRAGFPQDLFQPLLLSASRMSDVIGHHRIRAVSLTGSKTAGQAVAARAGKLLKKTVLELGGSDPYLILEDADLNRTVDACVSSRLLNSGQSCIAAKRFLVVESARKSFEAMLVEKMRAQKMGNPLDEDVEVGPLARADLRNDLHRQVSRSIERGARCLLGGEIPQGKGAFYPPTVLTDVCKGMPAFDEETFGPVAAVVPVKDEAEAIRVANDTRFGLGAAIFTKDINRGERIATTELEAGVCFVNAFVKSDPRLPFGGIKESGYGRELSHYGIKEFVNIKTVSIN